MFSFDSKDSPHMCFGPSRVEQNRFNCLVLAFHVFSLVLHPVMEHVIPVILATEVCYCLEWAEVLRVCGVSATVRRVYEPPALHLLKQSARQASGRLGYHACIRRPWSTMSTNFGAAPFAFWRRLWTAVPRPTGAFGDPARPALRTTRATRAASQQRGGSPNQPACGLHGLDPCLAPGHLADPPKVPHSRRLCDPADVGIDGGGAGFPPLFAEVRKHRVLAPPSSDPHSDLRRRRECGVRGGRERGSAVRQQCGCSQ